jgi:AmmeMemoRadiSam system protein B
VRPPAVAGLFYPDDPVQCRGLAHRLGFGPEIAQEAPDPRQPIGHSLHQWIGAIVPHAGWVASGAIAGESLRALALSLRAPRDVVVVFGAVHTPFEL